MPQSRLLLIDSFDGGVICEYADPVGMQQAQEGPLEEPEELALSAAKCAAEMRLHPPEPSFSPDSQSVLCGQACGDVVLWNTTTAEVVRRLKGHSTVPQFAMFCPAKAMLATVAHETMAWWISP